MTDKLPAVLPTEADEARFWALIERAWAQLDPAANEARHALARRDPESDEGDLEAVEEHREEFLEHLRALCDGMTSAELTDLDRVLERKLYEIDREDIHEHTDGSDDGFLYCRGFIVALGREFYAAVVANPAVAVLDAELEEMCYFFDHLHHERFGEYAETGSGISRESTTNAAGWA
ncbi:DUF4240 domain-containing protein [Virgisporangium aurantiacum]|uniref:DUF4240 domain-containing protein n=1 Tax=Virgisporangium aurantiacum TaxID=175570 RepID=A0A8J4E4N9_9ACTN|nr:DUF4240 domain-containing protein [Virgisporangium aurantiacum]GIJ61436.1 hypothetical protein Vau01_089520 [Virgisporangium aurantiacum]